MHIYIYIYICTTYIYICCAFVGLDNKPYKMQGKYIKIKKNHLCIKCALKDSERVYRPEQFVLVPDGVSWHIFRNEHVRMRVKVYYGISF